MLKKIIISILVVIMIMLNFNIYASVPVTKSYLNDALLRFITEVYSDSDNFSYYIGEEDYFIITYDGIENKVNFDLNSSEPKFFVEQILNKKNSYSEYKETQNSSLFLVYPYMAVADIQGYDAKKAFVYGAISVIEGIFEIAEKTEKGYENLKIVSDDYVAEEGEQIIRDSEFGTKMIEIYDEIYKESVSYTDECNTYKLIVKNEYVDENTRKLVTEMIVNPEANFSKISDYIEEKGEKMQESFNESLKKLEESIIVDEENKETKPVQGSKPTQNNMSKIPYAGLETNKLVYILGANIIILLISLIIFLNKKKNRN